MDHGASHLSCVSLVSLYITSLIGAFSLSTIDNLGWMTLIQGAALCIVGCLATSLTSSAVAPSPSWLLQSKGCPDTTECPLGEELPLIENHCSRTVVTVFHDNRMKLSYVRELLFLGVHYWIVV